MFTKPVLILSLLSLASLLFACAPINAEQKRQAQVRPSSEQLENNAIWATAQNDISRNATVDDIAWRDEYLPLAVEWIDELIASNRNDGRSLTGEEIEIARKVGVTYPEKVRIIRIDRIPLPEQGQFAEAIIPFGLIPENARGLTTGPVIFIDTDLAGLPEDLPTVIQHELVHVSQYERLGIEAFFSDYLLALKVSGPSGVPHEIEAYTKQSW